ncbi:MAG TPA: DNA gyrase subunit A [Patescibacteria group bacterium]|nr:DNA gyrase subunit A [Patescibacteria group bacterium]
MRYCVTGDSLVTTDHGLVRIDSLGTSSTEENISIKVLSKDQKINTATKWFNSGKHLTRRIITNRGFTIQGTLNHPLLVWSKNSQTGRPELSWKLLGKIKKGDYLALDRSDALWPDAEIPIQKFWPKNMNPRVEKKKLPTYFTADLAYIMGCLLSEGTLQENKYEFCNSDSDWIQEFKETWSRVFPDCRIHEFKRNPSSFGKKPYIRLEIHSKYVLAFLKNLDLIPAKSPNRRVPSPILKSPKHVVATFLKAYFEGDGSISFSRKMTELSAISVSEKLISELQILLLHFGIAGTKRFDSYRDTHKLYIRGLENYRLFTKHIGFISMHKQSKLENAIARLHKVYSTSDFVPFFAEFTRTVARDESIHQRFLTRHNFDRYPTLQKNASKVAQSVKPNHMAITQSLIADLLEQKYLFDPVTGIEDTGVQTVYSIRVESDCHSFVANGFISHNTESRMAKEAEELLQDLDKDTVTWRDNYDATRKEPEVLPAKLPNLLLNGSLGIAVGMATDIPPHNLAEVVDGICMLIDDPKATVDDLLTVIKGPDFPTGGIMYDWPAIKNAYATGKGRIVVRGKTDIIENKNGTYSIIITEIPYRVNKATMLERIADLVRDKKLEGIKDVRDESDKDGVRVVIELKREAMANKILNQVFKFTQLQDTFHLNMMALVDGIEPRVLNLKSVLEEYVKHRQLMVRKRIEYELRKAKERAHILEGLSIALDNIDAVIKTIRNSATKEEAHAALMKKFKLSEIQAQAILDMRLQTLAGLERKKIEDELKEKRKLIAELEAILKSEKKILGIIKAEILELKDKFGDDRRTKLVKAPLGEFSVEDLIPEESFMVIVTKSGYVKRITPDTYRVQARGGKGVIGQSLKDEDVVDQLISANSHDDILFFTNKGRAFMTKVYELPEGSRTAKGQALVNFLQLGSGESATGILTLAKNDQTKYIVLATKTGVIKKVAREELRHIRRSGIIAMSLKAGDELKWVKTTTGEDQIMLASEQGLAVRFNEKDIRAMGRTAAGVTGMRFKKKGDQVISMDVIQKAKNLKSLEVLVVTENGLGKRSALEDYRTVKRGGKGVVTVTVTPKTGKVIAMHILDASNQEGEMVIISRKGQTIKTRLGEIRTMGRSAQGVRVIRLDNGDQVASATIV